MMPPDNRKPGEPVGPLRKPRLTDEERAALGEPPGREQELERLRLKREEDALERIEAEIAEVEAYRMPLMEHLVELKDRLLKAFAALLLGCGVGFFYAREIYEFLAQPWVDAAAAAPGIEAKLALVHSPFEGVYVYFRVSFIAGLMLSLPVISWQIWQFIAPGLYRTERRMVAPLSMVSVFLFMLGAGFCYYALLPFALPFFLDVLELDATLSADGYLKAVTRMMLAFGVCFQLPVGAFFLARIGVVDARDMFDGLRYAVVVIFLLAAVITPPDPLTQLLLAVPMVLLYVLGIFIAWGFSTKQRDEEGVAIPREEEEPEEGEEELG